MTRVPSVSGPIAGTRPPWGTPRVDVAQRGYVVEEFHIEGPVVAYQLMSGTEASPDGHWSAEESGDGTYRTRLLVVRPIDHMRFNGTVVVNWQNVSAGFEGGGPTEEIYDGYAWVGVSAQEVGLYGFAGGLSRRTMSGGAPLLEHDPERYGSLFHPGDQGSFDIFAQAGRVVGPDRGGAGGGGGSGGDVDPMGGLEVRRLIAAGGSQSAMRLAAYLNAVHPIDPVFDGFLLAVWEGRAPRPEEGAMPTGVRTAIRTDGSTPVIVVNSEFEAPNVAALGMRDTEHLRIWEVAGTPHGVARSRFDQPDGRGRVVNSLSYAPVHEAALRALHHWLADGTPAPSQPRMAVEPDGRGSILRDDYGNAVGGIRLPELDAPTHEYRGVAFGSGRAPLFGAARPFTEDELRGLYRSRDEYVARWHAAVDRLVRDAALRPEDGPAMKAKVDEVALPFD